MQPLALQLQQLHIDSSSAPGVTLIPVGLLTLLPLHAAWTGDASKRTGRRYLLDDFIVNYAPSALTFSHALGVAERESADCLLAVEEPVATSASPLPNVHAEVTAIARLFDEPVILAREKATREAVLQALPQADVVHLSCHGSNNWRSPLDSGLLMADDATGRSEILTVGDLLDLELAGGRLATLSACETGIAGTDLPDEVVVLSSALLQAGYGGVVASLWSVSDISTAMLMEHFYTGWRKGDLTPSDALRSAQQWLRDTTNEEKAEYFKRYSPKLLAGLRMPEAEAIDLFNQLMTRDLDSCDFAHPFWWAAFYMTGA
jgi:CHAT domain-containing protein